MVGDRHQRARRREHIAQRHRRAPVPPDRPRRSRTPSAFGLWPGRTTRGSGGRNDRVELGSGTGAGCTICGSRLDDTAAFIQFIAETLVPIRGRVLLSLRAREGEITDLVAATGFNRQYPTRYVIILVVLLQIELRVLTKRELDAHAACLNLPSRLIACSSGRSQSQ